jgi:hypothetical protein
MAYTYKFIGLVPPDTIEGLLYTGTLPYKAEEGQILKFSSGNSYRVVRAVDGGIPTEVGADHEAQEGMAWADINREEFVDEIYLELIEDSVVKTFKYDADENVRHSMAAIKSLGQQRQQGMERFERLMRTHQPEALEALREACEIAAEISREKTKLFQYLAQKLEGDNMANLSKTTHTA